MLGWLKKVAVPVAAIAGLFMTGSIIRANTLEIASVSQAGKVFTYTASLASSNPGSSQLQSGDFFTIFDFAGFTGPSDVVTPTGWVFLAVQNVGSPLGLPPSQNPPDSPALPNLTWQYTDGTVTSNNGVTVPIAGTFSAKTTLTGVKTGNYSSQDHELVGSTFGPSGHTAGASVPVPLPATANMGLVLLGSVGGLGAFRRLKNSKTVEA